MGSRVGRLVCAEQNKVFRSSSITKPHLSSNGHQANGHLNRNTGIERHCKLSDLKVYAKTPAADYFMMDIHIKARCEVYPRTKDVFRCKIRDEQVPWEVEFSDYTPTEYTNPKFIEDQPEWADSPDCSGIPFNVIDQSCNVDRRSYTGTYNIVNTRPLNPKGRTGCSGRGTLGRWGPNHAADPIVTRWKRDESGKQVLGSDGKPILQFVAVQRRDNGEWALPGGMVNPGENRTASLIREFGEEALNTLEASDEQKQQIQTAMDSFFQCGSTIYKGYVDDPRNTDNSWMETKAINFHDECGTSVGAFSLHAGDDAAAVQWMDIDHTLSLYASHIHFIKATVDRLQSHW